MNAGTGARPCRVLIVDDSPVFLEALGQLYSSDPELQVIATASTAREAIAKTAALRPDVISLDLGLPDVDGFEVVRHVMGEQPTPILVLTATLNPSWRREAYYALTLGAIDVVEKPTHQAFTAATWRQGMCDRLKFVARSPVIPHVAHRVRARTAKHFAARPAPPAYEFDLVAIVGSAGSPRAVTELLTAMRADMPLPFPVAVAMHLGRGMGASFARYLREELQRDVQAIEDGMRLAKGVVYVAPGGIHVEVQRSGIVRLIDNLPDCLYKPSLDHFLRSVAQTYANHAMGAVLTGMGADGSSGLLAMHQAGASTFAQELSTCLVDSMPKNALDNGAAQELALEAMALIVRQGAADRSPAVWPTQRLGR